MSRARDVLDLIEVKADFPKFYSKAEAEKLIKSIKDAEGKILDKESLVVDNQKVIQVYTKNPKSSNPWNLFTVGSDKGRAYIIPLK